MEYYSQQADGLCCSLTAICPKILPSVIGLSYKDEWEVERQSITLNKKIGEGDFGGIWEGLWNQSTLVLVEAYGASSLDIQELQDEIQILKKIQHENILLFYAASTVTECTVGEPIYIITEFMKNASILLDYLRNDSGCVLTLPKLIDVAAQVASGMAYLEARNYIHRNLAAKYVLIGEAKNVKIKLPLQRNKAAIKWRAPEAALHNRFSIKSDVWSFGIFLFELVTHGQEPYPGITNNEILPKLLEGYHMPRPLACPDDLYRMMERCWTHDTGSRPTFETLEWELKEFFTVDDSLGYREPS